MVNTKPADKKSVPGKTGPQANKIPVATVQRQNPPQAHIQQAAPATAVYKPPPGVQPCPAPVPAPVPAPAPATDSGHLELIQRILEQHETFKLILDQLTAIVKSTGTSAKPEVEYYNTPQTAIQVATPIPPMSPDIIANAAANTPGYQIESVYNAVQRISPRITVINDGSDTIFVITTPDSTNWSSEAPILVGEARTFFNVWELRLRSPNAGDITKLTGGIYRVTEFDFWLAYATNPNRSLFTAQRLAVPFGGAGSTITDLLIAAGTLLAGQTLRIPNGFSLVVRSYVANAAGSFVFVAGPIPPAPLPALPNPPVDAVTNVGVAGTRNSLAPADTARIFVRNTDSVALLGSVAGLFVDILVEQ